jgi:hypothetical protein
MQAYNFEGSRDVGVIGGDLAGTSSSRAKSSSRSCSYWEPSDCRTSIE